MSEQLGPLDVDCDAPPYAVVAACEGLGFQAPLDVRWCRTSHSQADRASKLLGWFHGKGRPEQRTCTCGQSLPLLEPYTFPFISEKRVVYFLGQCRRCRTIYWEEGPPDGL